MNKFELLDFNAAIAEEQAKRFNVGLEYLIQQADTMCMLKSMYKAAKTDEHKNMVAAVAQECLTISTEDFKQIYTRIVEGIKALGNKILEIFEAIKEKLRGIRTYIVSKLGKVKTDIEINVNIATAGGMAQVKTSYAWLKELSNISITDGENEDFESQFTAMNACQKNIDQALKREEQKLGKNELLSFTKICDTLVSLGTDIVNHILTKVKAESSRLDAKYGKKAGSKFYKHKGLSLFHQIMGMILTSGHTIRAMSNDATVAIAKIAKMAEKEEKKQDK